MSNPLERNSRANIEYQLQEWRIKLGIPVGYPELIKDGGDFFVIGVPKDPHVFFCKRIRFKEKGIFLTEISNAIVMIGHGITYGEQENDWRFLGTRQSISETVRAYEGIANLCNLPPLDVIIACRVNPYPVQKSKVRTLFTTREVPYIFADSNVIIGDADEYDEWSNWYYPGEGVKVIITKADKWYGIDRWNNYWQSLQELRETRSIPQWAKNPR